MKKSKQELAAGTLEITVLEEMLQEFIIHV